MQINPLPLAVMTVMFLGVFIWYLLPKRCPYCGRRDTIAPSSYQHSCLHCQRWFTTF